MVEGFLSPENESRLDKLLYSDFQRRLGTDLSEKQKDRLVKTVRHYMKEVQQTIPQESIVVKNKEVLTAVVPDFLSYVRRSSITFQKEDETMKQDVSSRFAQLQNERNPKKAAPPPPPDFRIPLSDEGPLSMEIFQEIKKQRDDEQRRAEDQLNARISSERNFQSAREAASANDQMMLTNRDAARIASQREAASELANRMVPPDPRRIFMKDVLENNPLGMQQPQSTTLESIFRNQNPLETSGLGTANMTLALPGPVRSRPTLPQDTLIPQDDILTYKENEYNLFIWSADRDWLSDARSKDTVQNRYNFVVNFDPANNRAGQLFGVNAAASIKFKNITRVEFVKAILPVEGVNNIVRKTGSALGATYDASLNTNILSFPYLNVYVKELDTNNYGTDFYFERAFATLQYDANWISDNNVTTKGGYLAMIPKFLKCQKVYHPTPLATLQKLTIRMERPNGDLISDVPDTFDVSGFIFSSNLNNCPSSPAPNVLNTKFADISGYYIWVECSKYFNRFSVNTGDWVRFRGLTFPSSSFTTTGQPGAIADFVQWLQGQDHLVVGTAWNNKQAGGVTYYTDGGNRLGYSRYIIIQNRYPDPTTGLVQPTTFGSLSAANNTTFLNAFCGVNLTAGKFINLSRQTHLVFRIITRDMDSTSRLRPDNL